MQGRDAGPETRHYGAAMPGRRGFLAAAAALTGGLLAAPATSARAAAAKTAWAAGLQLTLPPPTGPQPVGTIALHLIDYSRQDPFLSAPHPRELMISLWYPACTEGPSREPGGRYPLVPWIPPVADRLLLAQLVPPPLIPVTLPGGVTGYEPGPPLSISLDGVSLPVTSAGLGLPAAPLAGGSPVVLYSPGDEVDREFCTAQAEDLASHGYVVVTIDHTYEAPEVVFPGGRLVVQVNPQPPGTTVLTTRIADARFVLNSLEVLAAGGNPDAEGQPVPSGLAQILDLSKTGMFGHSLGGDTAAQVMAADGRVTAGIDLDGSIAATVPSTNATAGELAGEVATAIGGRPFMIMTSDGRGPFAIPGQPQDPTMVGFWANLQGWRLFLTMPNAQHLSYTDYEAFLSQLAAAGIITASDASEVVVPYLGVIVADQAIAAQRAYIQAFFDLQLRQVNSHLLDGPSAQYPQVSFVASGL